MSIKGIRIHFVLITAVMVLAALFGIQYIYHKMNVEEPLYKLYSQTKAVQKFNIENKDQVMVVNINLKKTDNLEKTYTELYQTTSNVLGKSNFTLNIKDKPDSTLESAFYNMQFIINEALMRGNFSDMERIIDEKAYSVGATSKVYIDDKNIYIQLEKKDNFIYRIVPRPQASNESLTNDKSTGGGQVG